MKKIPIVDGEGNCCPECGSLKITVHEQRNLQVDINLITGKAFKIKNGKMKQLTNKEKAIGFDGADSVGGGGCWSYECRKCGWTSEVFHE